MNRAIEVLVFGAIAALIAFLCFVFVDVATSRYEVVPGSIAGKSYTPERSDLVVTADSKGDLQTGWVHSSEEYRAIVSTARGTNAARLTPEVWAAIHERSKVSVRHVIGGLSGRRYRSDIVGLD